MVRLNSACVRIRKRIAALESLLASQQTDTNDHRSSPSRSIFAFVCLHFFGVSTEDTAKASTNETAVRSRHHPTSSSVVDPHSRTLDQVINKGIQDFLDFEIKFIFLERRVAERRVLRPRRVITCQNHQRHHHRSIIFLDKNIITCIYPFDGSNL